MAAKPPQTIAVRVGCVAADVAEMGSSFEGRELTVRAGLSVNLSLTVYQDGVLRDRLLRVLRVERRAMLRVAGPARPRQREAALEDCETVLVGIAVADSPVRRRLEGDEQVFLRAIIQERLQFQVMILTTRL